MSGPMRGVFIYLSTELSRTLFPGPD